MTFATETPQHVKEWQSLFFNQKAQTMETVCSLEMAVNIYKTTRRHMPEHSFQATVQRLASVFNAMSSLAFTTDSEMEWRTLYLVRFELHLVVDLRPTSVLTDRL
jgi:isocitrate/isopropylmalate dehydrogenase